MLPYNTIVKVKKYDFITREDVILILRIRPINLLDLDEVLSKHTGNFVDYSIDSRELIEYCGQYIIPNHNGWIKFTENEIIKEFGSLTFDEIIEQYPEYLI